MDDQQLDDLEQQISASRVQDTESANTCKGFSLRFGDSYYDDGETAQINNHYQQNAMQQDLRQRQLCKLKMQSKVKQIQRDIFELTHNNIVLYLSEPHQNSCRIQKDSKSEILRTYCQDCKKNVFLKKIKQSKDPGVGFLSKFCSVLCPASKNQISEKLYACVNCNTKFLF